jgi:release factor glutamine methyltransferase
VLETLPHESLTIVDLGTGCGAIACALALSRPQWRVIGVDISAAAINIATLNAKRLNIPNIEWRHSSWLEGFDEHSIDAIVSNPPYLQAEDEHLQGALLFEPLGALVSGKTGFEAYETIIAQAPGSLKKGGRLFFEHGFSQAEGIRSRLEQAGFHHLQTYEDLSGHCRVTQGIVDLSSL